MTTSPSRRLLFVDWHRGLAVLLMIQTHAIDAWLKPSLRGSWLFGKSQLLGGFPAPAFLFLAGLSASLAYGKIERQNPRLDERLWLSIRRGVEIFGLALLFRLQEFSQWLGGADWRGLFKVDILNTIGLSLALVGIVQALVPRRLRLAAFSALAFLVSFLSPFVWASKTLSYWPWPLRGYLVGRPSSGLFPLFPWLAFALAGASVGSIISWHRSRHNPRHHYLYLALALAAALLLVAGRLMAEHLNHPAGWLFWHNSGEYLLIRVGIQLLTLSGAYLLCLPFRSDSFSVVRLLGRHSLPVYWVHLSLVYGVWLQALKGRLGPWPALAGVALLTGLMALLALAIDRWKDIKLRLPPKRLSKERAA
jgi:uncharacterized membrane protein